MLMRDGIKPEKGRTVNPKSECRTSVTVPWFGVPRLCGPLQTPPPDRLEGGTPNPACARLGAHVKMRHAHTGTVAGGGGQSAIRMTILPKFKASDNPRIAPK